MINVEFTDKLQEEAVQGVVFSTDTPSFISDIMKNKPHEQVYEIFQQDEKTLSRLVVTKIKKQSREGREEAGAILFKKADGGVNQTLSLDLKTWNEEGLDVLTGMLLYARKFDKYQTRSKSDDLSTIKKIVVLCDNPQEYERQFQLKKAMIAGVHFAKALTSEPPNVMYPSAYAERLQELKTVGIEVEVLSKQKLQSLQMNAILAVGEGSERDPCVVVLKWNGQTENEQPLALVGKGVCFDSGGLCIKPALHQREMKWDKAGAGVVAGTIKALALAKAPVNVVGVVGLVENMPDGKAARPGDVITTMSGQTVEIVDTDAEGRLVLADCLSYVQKFHNPKTIVDLGTLTPETFAALGSAYAALYCHDAHLAGQLKSAGEKSGDHLWELPMGAYFAKQNESAVADMRNSGIVGWGENGAAAEFLRNFVQMNSWAHLDIAGVSWVNEDLPTCRKGVTGFGVRLLFDWITKQ